MAAGDAFTTVRSLGGLLPSDLLVRVAHLDKDLPGLGPEDYHLAKGERIREVVSRSWSRLQGAWVGFREESARLAESDTGTTITREKWLLILFQELGYGRLQTTRAFEIEGSTFPVSHLWAKTPIHLVSFRLDLDRREKGVAGASRSAPHSMLQEYLNRSDDHLWGILSNGHRLRILRDNAAMTRQAFVEFDLEAMMEGEVYSDFVLLWLLAHQSRVEGAIPEQCLLERWVETANRDGTRALDRLRDGVTRALETLGTGFLAHRGNADLRAALSGNGFSDQDYYRELLRLVYRLLFLLVTEERGVLLDPDADPNARETYLRHYAVKRLRDRAAKQVGSRHGDLWEGLRRVFKLLGSPEGCPPLALKPLGGLLWTEDSAPHLDAAELSNGHLLEAIRHLTFTRDGKLRRAVDYRNLGSEELGSVYESLLELHPRLDPAERSFALGQGAGSERKTTGSYYTPSALISQLLDTALDPVVDEAMKEASPEKAILALKVVDPACGSGHFLVAAAHRMAKRLATARTGEGEPAPEDTQRALRDVVSHCLYGVDVNPMALELAKVSLWLEAHVPGKPLTFLDHHFRSGDSLLGATPALIARGIPDDAFQAIEGDDKKICAGLKKSNRDWRDRLLISFLAETPAEYNTVTSQARAIGERGDETYHDLAEKEARFRAFESSKALQAVRRAADAWCAAFLVEKTLATRNNHPAVAFQGLRDGTGTDPKAIERVDACAREYRLLHWHLAFPDVFRSAEPPYDEDPVGWGGGFDVVLGNPPWERIKLQEKEFFAARSPEVAEAPNAAAREKLIRKLEGEDPALHASFLAAKRQAEAASVFVRNSGRYPLCGRGDVNTYSIFAELMRTLMGPKGRVGCIVPSGIATDDTTKHFFRDLIERRSLHSLLSFHEIRKLFPDTDSRDSFCLLTMTGSDSQVTAPEFAFSLLDTAELRDSERWFTLSADEIALLNPNTRTCPIFRSKRDAEITKAIYRRVPVLIEEGPPEKNPWGVSFMAMFHMSNDSGLFRTREQLEGAGWTLEGNVFVRGEERYLPLYEAKMIHHFDHRWATYAGPETQDMESSDKADPRRSALPRYWVPEAEVAACIGAKGWRHGWLLGWRDICRSTDERTVIAGVIPRVGSGDTFLLMFPSAAPTRVGALLATLDSLILDFAARQKIGGTHLKYHTFKQLPILPPSAFDGHTPWQLTAALIEWIQTRALELTYTAMDLQPLAKDLGHDGPPFRWSDDRRFQIRCELDAAFFHLYGIDLDDVDYILDTFPIVRRNDEKAHGEYRTKRVILEIYDALATATQTGRPYQSPLDPPPGTPPAGARKEATRAHR